MINLNSSLCDYITTDDFAYGNDRILAESEEHVANNNVSVNYILLHNLSSHFNYLLLQTIELLREEDFMSQSSGWDDQLDRYWSILLMTLLVFDFSWSSEVVPSCNLKKCSLSNSIIALDIAYGIDKVPAESEEQVTITCNNVSKLF